MSAKGFLWGFLAGFLAAGVFGWVFTRIQLKRKGTVDLGRLELVVLALLAVLFLIAIALLVSDWLT